MGASRQKKIYSRVFSAWLLFSAAAALFGQTITVTSPTPGVTWYKGQTYLITWALSGTMDTHVNIRLRDEAGTDWAYPIANNVANNGSFSFTVPGTIDDGGYRVRIATVDKEVSGRSDIFQIKLQPSKPAVKVIAPNGGESWTTGIQQTIRWSGGGGGLFRLELLRSEGGQIPIKGEVIAENLKVAQNQKQFFTGSYSWKVGQYIGGTALPGDYLVRVVSQSDSTVSDRSDATFKILMPKLDKGLIDKIPKKAAPIRKDAKITNWLGKKTFPKLDANPAHWDLIRNRPNCAAGGNTFANVGVTWLTLDYNQGIKLAGLYRSRLIFNPAYGTYGASNLKKATLKMRQVSSSIVNVNWAHGLSSISVLTSPWEDFHSFTIGKRYDIPSNQTEFEIDVTDTVRQWLDGALPNHGLILMGRGELVSSQNPPDYTCFSCFEAWLELLFDK